MLNKYQIAVLDHIVENQEELIIESAKEENVDENASIGVAKFLLGNPDNFADMSDKQQYHYDKVIKPLVSQVYCDGMIGIYEDGSSSCIGTEFIEDEQLLAAYQLEDMRCQQCISSHESWHANNP